MSSSEKIDVWQENGSTECNRVLCGSEDSGKFGIPRSLCTLGSSLADGGAQTSVKKYSSNCCNDMPSKWQLSSKHHNEERLAENFDFKTIWQSMESYHTTLPNKISSKQFPQPVKPWTLSFECWRMHTGQVYTTWRNHQCCSLPSYDPEASTCTVWQMSREGKYQFKFARSHNVL